MTKNNKKEIVLSILFESFYDNPATMNVVKQDFKKNKRYKLLLEYSYFLCSKFGKVYLSEDNCSCALILDSELKKVTLKLVHWYFVLAFNVIGTSRVKSILKRLQTLNSKRPKTSHLYIWYIGVKKSKQKNGLGTQLMEQILQDNPSRIICLETTKKELLTFYEKFDFKLTEQIRIAPFTFSLFRRQTI